MTEWESSNGIGDGFVGLRIGWEGDVWRFERFEHAQSLRINKANEKAKPEQEEEQGERRRREDISTLDAMLNLSTQLLKLGLEFLREEKLIVEYQARVASYGSQCKAWLRWGISGLVGETSVESVEGWQSGAEDVVRLWLQRPVLEDQERGGVEVLGRARLVLAEGVRLVEGRNSGDLGGAREL